MGALGALALWVEGNVIVASGTDHGLPRVESLSKPKKVGTGVLGPYSVRASDAWSPIVDVTWRYGDGSSEHGVSVRHAYARPGSYHVTVLVNDAAGNTAQRTFVVVVAPIARAVAARATPQGLRVTIACLPSSPSVSGTRDGRHPRREARAVPLQRARGGGSALVPGKAARGKRVVVRVTGFDLAGLAHLLAATLPVA